MNNGVAQYDALGIGYRYVMLAEMLAEGIASGRLGAGARLAGERALAAEYGVAVGTVRRATQELRERGLVVTLAAKGTYVTTNGLDAAGLTFGGGGRPGLRGASVWSGDVEPDE